MTRRLIKKAQAASASAREARTKSLMAQADAGGRASYVIVFRETGADRGPCWGSFDEVTSHPDPVKVARRYIRLVNHWANKPGGYDQVLARARVYQQGIWPAGDRLIAEVRAAKSPAEKERAKRRAARRAA